MQMKKKEMRLQFSDNELKDKLDLLASELDISLNLLVNMILKAHFNEADKDRMDFMIELISD